MKKMMKISAVFLITIMIVSLAACGSGNSSGGGLTGGAEPFSNYDYAPAAAEAPMADSNSRSEEAYGDYETSGGYDSVAGTVEGPATDNRKITFSANYRIETKRFDEDYNKIVDLVNNSNGYIANEDTDSRMYYSGSYGRASYFSLRIPVDKYNTFLDDIAEIGDVVNKNKSSEDLTSEYFDTESRIDLLKMRKDRLINYIETATDPEVIIEFERELSNVLYDLDYYEGSKRRLDRLVDYATIDVSLSEVITAETIGKDGEPLGERAQDAFDMSLNGVKEFLRDAAVFFAGAAPVIALIVVIIIVILLIRKLILVIRDKYNEKHPDRLQRKQMKADKKYRDMQQQMQYKQQSKMYKKQGTYYSQGYPAPPVQQPVQPTITPQTAPPPTAQAETKAEENDTEPKK